MRDTPIDVEPETFDAASKVVGQNMAGQLTDAVAGLEHGLADTSAMGGSDPGGMHWASVYDEAASATAGVVTDLANACCKIAEMLEQTGFNYGAADNASDPSRTVPTGPDTTTYFPRPTVTPTPPPSARGGTGTPPDGWGLIQQAVGYVWPNGDTGKLRAAAQAWTTAASTIEAANQFFPEAIEAIRSQQSPEVDDAATVCQTLSQHIEDTTANCRNLATACTDYANHLDQAHQDIENELTNLLASTALIEGAGVLATEIGGELWAQGIEAGRVAAAATRIGEILAPLTDTVTTAAESVTTIISKITQVAQRLKVILGAQITRATAAVVERLPGLAEDTETTATESLEATAEGPISLDSLNKAYDLANTPDKLEHVIDPDKHGFADLVRQSGGRPQALRKIIDSLGDHNDLPASGRFEVVRDINGETVVIRGAVIDGVPRLGTAFIPTKFPGVP